MLGHILGLNDCLECLQCPPPTCAFRYTSDGLHLRNTRPVATAVLPSVECSASSENENAELSAFPAAEEGVWRRPHPTPVLTVRIRRSKQSTACSRQFEKTTNHVVQKTCQGNSHVECLSLFLLGFWYPSFLQALLSAVAKFAGTFTLISKACRKVLASPSTSECGGKMLVSIR